MTKILIFDENPLAAKLIALALTERYSVYFASSVSEMNIILGRDKPKILIINTSAAKDGVKVAEDIRKSDKPYSKVAIVFMGEKPSMDLIKRVKAVKAAEYIELPFDIDDFDRRISEVNVTVRGLRDKETGLYRKGYIEEKLRQRMADRRQGLLFLINIDRYSFVSNTVDAAQLQLCIYAIQKELGEKILLGRNGDTIIGFIGGEINRDEAKAMMKHLISVMQEAVTENQIYVCIGLADAKTYNYSYDDMYVDCDRALGLSRSNGKNTCNYYF